MPLDLSAHRAQRARREDRNLLPVARVTSSPHEDTEPQSGHSSTYEHTRIDGNARPVLGNVYHTYNYFKRPKGLSRHNDRPCSTTISEEEEDLQISTTRSTISPDAISDYDPDRALWLRREQRIPHTCEWIFSVPEYKSWHSGTGPGVLICAGSLGCGKSVTAGAVIDSLISEQDHGTRLILSYFVDPTLNTPITAPDVLRAIIKQFLVYHQDSYHELPSELREQLRVVLPASKAFTGTRILIETIQAFISNTARECVVVIDGIDILKEHDALELLRFPREIFAYNHKFRQQTKMVLFCRDTVGRGIQLGTLPNSTMLQIDLDHIEPDIHAFVDHLVSVKQSEQPITNDLELEAEIKRVLKANSAKMFLWVQLQVNSIWDPSFSTSSAAIRAQLNALPKTLDETYIRCLWRIEMTNIDASSSIAPKVFSWTALASRPLTLTETQELVSMDYANQYSVTSDILSSISVVDYCANLVLHNTRTGCVEFAHPSVKDMLSDSGKIPSGLAHFHLSYKNDLACGHLCLKYIEQYSLRNKIVRLEKQSINTNVTSPVLQTVSEVLSPSWRWIGQFANLKRNDKKRNYYSLPMPIVKPKQRVVADSASHDYICKNWLWHTTHTEINSLDYPLLAELSLCHDVETQPWATSQTRDRDHFERLVAYAVSSNHLPLLLVAKEHFEIHTKFLDVFDQPCSGTDSSLLHVAAALGHVQITDFLLKVSYEDYADGKGRSAAAVAIECNQNEVLSKIITYRRVPRFVHSLKHLKGYGYGSHEIRESLLEICAAAGNLDAMTFVLKQIVDDKAVQNALRFLSAAMFIACQKGHIRLAKYLVDTGANPNLYFDPVNGTPWSEYDHWIRQGRSSLREALRLRDTELFENLLRIGADPESDNNHPTKSEIYDHPDMDVELMYTFVNAIYRNQRSYA